MKRIELIARKTLWWFVIVSVTSLAGGKVMLAYSQSTFEGAPIIEVRSDDNANQDELSIYYLDFLVSTYKPVTPNMIGKSTYFLTKTNSRASKYILKSLSSEGCPSVFDEDRTRLLVVNKRTGERMLVDQEGTVRKGNKQYLMRPLAFLELHQDLKSIEARINSDSKKAGIKG